MATKKNLVKSMLMSILTAGIFSFGFIACSEDEDIFANEALAALEGNPKTDQDIGDGDITAEATLPAFPIR